MKTISTKKSHSKGEEELILEKFDVGSDKWMVKMLKKKVKELESRVGELGFDLDTCRTAKKAYKNSYIHANMENKALKEKILDLDPDRKSDSGVPYRIQVEQLSNLLMETRKNHRKTADELKKIKKSLNDVLKITERVKNE